MVGQRSRRQLSDKDLRNASLSSSLANLTLVEPKSHVDGTRGNPLSILQQKCYIGLERRVWQKVADLSRYWVRTRFNGQASSSRLPDWAARWSQPVGDGTDSHWVTLITPQT